MIAPHTDPIVAPIITPMFEEVPSGVVLVLGGEFGTGVAGAPMTRPVYVCMYVCTYVCMYEVCVGVHRCVWSVHQ